MSRIEGRRKDRKGENEGGVHFVLGLLIDLLVRLYPADAALHTGVIGGKTK